MFSISTTPSQFIALLVTIAVVYPSVRAFYNIFLHPLRSVPGPIYCQVTSLVYHIIQLKGRSHLWLQRQHEKYGTAVRVSPYDVSFIDPEAWRDIYGHKADRSKIFEKDYKFYGPDIYGSPPGMMRASAVDHARQRKIVSPAFSERALKSQEGLLKGYVNLLIKQLKSASVKENSKVNMADWYNFTTFDIMADLLFGESLGLLEGSAYTPWVSAVFDNISLLLYAQIMRAWPALSAVLGLFVPESLQERRRRHMKHTVDHLEKRLKRETDRPDIVTYILRNTGDEKGQADRLADTEMHSNAGLFMTAGTETTATELSGLTWMLLKDPERMERLKIEVRTAFRSFDEISISALSQLEYLSACIEEGLRLFPPVAVGLPRIVPNGGAVVAGKLMPEGVSVQIPSWSMHHSSLHFRDPNDFKPERWLPEGQARYGDDNKAAMNPFSYGPTNCLGKVLAYYEMRLVLASVLLHFDLELCKESDNWLPDLKTVPFWKKGPLWVKLRSVEAL